MNGQTPPRTSTAVNRPSTAGRETLTPPLAIEANDLRKSFPVAAGWSEILRPKQWREALRGVSVKHAGGRVLAILGANGAGKTTLIKILCTALLPDGGWARVFGHDVVEKPMEVKRRLGMVVNEERSFYYRLSCRNNLEFFASLWDLNGTTAQERIEEVLRLVDLLDRIDDRFDRLSTGMRQRMAIARGLLMNPDILFLDEPTRSLDPVATRQIHAFIREDLVQKHGKTVVVATNNLEESQVLAQDLLVLRQGEVAAAGEVDAIMRGGNDALLDLLQPAAEENAQ